ncbi:hypothetical protein AMJ47_00290 [Parcubacteria bacterium DG_72]|nr:MAG: hypothetical protein AMJ47_00290 [Parcubacteria bacterium DG_72]
MNYPIVSIIIPCFNEGNFIAKCLDSIIAQDYPKDKIEVLVIDGMSEDKTREVVKEYSLKHPFIKLLENPKKITSSGLNIGIKASSGDIIVRMDAHARYREDYLSKCVEYIKKGEADNVGGITRTVPVFEDLVSKAVALCLNSVFGSGNSYFRTGTDKPMYVDTVFGGCYKKEVFKKIGLFNENMARSQDIELNLRLKKAGGKILLVPEIISYYYPKSSIKDFFWHNVGDGAWAILPLKFTKAPLRIRHYIPLLFVLSLLSIFILSLFIPFFWIVFFSLLVLYFLISVYFSLKISIRERNILLLFVMPMVFSARHLGYGTGSLIGISKILWKKESKKK